MMRALAWSIIALMVIVVAFFVVPWVISQTNRVRRQEPKIDPGELDRYAMVARLVPPEERDASRPFDEHEGDLDGPDGPHDRPTV